MLEKIEHVFNGSVSLSAKVIHLALEVNSFLGNLYAYDGS
jgi:hypothetical protein